MYEIYFASHQSTENQYLCTVSCGVAVRDGKVFHTDGDHQLLSPYSEGSHDNLSKENVKCDKNNSNGEDDWVRVDVKVQESSVLGDEENSSQLKFCLPQEMITQVYFVIYHLCNTEMPFIVFLSDFLQFYCCHCVVMCTIGHICSFYFLRACVLLMQKRENKKLNKIDVEFKKCKKAFSRP